MGVKFSFNLRKPPRLPVCENGLYLIHKRKDAPIVILVHGLTGTPNEMQFLAHFLKRRGYSVLCPRLANHGEPIEILKQTRWQEFYESVRQAFLKIENSKHGAPVFVAGLSMGALLALLLAEEFPSRIAGVSCLSPTLFYDGWNIPWTSRLLPLAYWTPLKHFAYFKEEPPYGIKNEKIRQRVHDYYQDAELHHLTNVAKFGYPYFPVTLFCELRLLIKHLNKRLPLIDVPVQCIQAKDDDMTSVRNSTYIHDRIRSKVKEIFLLYDSYHVITADQERGAVAQEMDAFFNRLLHKDVSVTVKPVGVS